MFENISAFCLHINHFYYCFLIDFYFFPETWNVYFIVIVFQVFFKLYNWFGHTNFFLRYFFNVNNLAQWMLASFQIYYVLTFIILCFSLILPIFIYWKKRCVMFFIRIAYDRLLIISKPFIIINISRLPFKSPRRLIHLRITRLLFVSLWLLSLNSLY